MKEKHDDEITKKDYVLGYTFVVILVIGIIVAGFAIMQMS